jgi:hypothetical protein
VAKRADDVLETNLIQLDLLRRLLEAPMALCDLSSRNPNVLFELGLRQAFDKPVAIVQEEGTPRIFDISPLRFSVYRKARIYNEVLADQEAIAEAILATRKAASDPKSVNSLVRLLGLTEPASLADLKDSEHDPAFQLVRAELADLRREIRTALRPPARGSKAAVEVSSATSIHENSPTGIYVALPPDEFTTMIFTTALSNYCGTPADHMPTPAESGLEIAYPTFIRLLKPIPAVILARAIEVATKDARLSVSPEVRFAVGV